MDKSDTVLSRKIKKGDAQSFRELYDRYHKQLYYLARHYLKDKNLAEDAVQDIFLKCWDNRGDLDPSSSIEGLLFTMLKNHVLNMIRDENTRQKMIGEMKNIAQNNSPKNAVEEEVIYAEYERFLKKAVSKLSPAKREVFELRSFEGLSNAEAADEKGVSEHTVKTQYYLGSKFIRNYLKKHIGLFTLVLVLLVNGLT